MKTFVSWLIANFETVATIVLSLVFCLLIFRGTDWAAGEDKNFCIGLVVSMVLLMAVPSLFTAKSFGVTLVFFILIIGGLIYTALNLSVIKPEAQIYSIAVKLLISSVPAFILAIPVGVFTAKNMDEVVSLRMLYVNSNVDMFEMTLKYTLNRFMTAFIYLVWAGFWTAVYLDIVSKFSLYDILAMIVPGGAILVAIALMINNLLVINTNLIEKPLFWIIGLTGAYLVGLLNHTLTSAVWGKFRNNELMLKSSLKNAKSYLPENGRVGKLTSAIDLSNTDKIKIINCIWLMKSVIIAYLIFSTVMLAVYCTCHKCESRDIALIITIPFIAILICVIVELIYTLEGGKTSDPDVIQKYYSAYYFVAKHKYSDDISIIEGQIAFLQSMVLPFFVVR